MSWIRNRWWLIGFSALNFLHSVNGGQIQNAKEAPRVRQEVSSAQGQNERETSLPLTTNELDRLWKDLDSPDAMRAYEAILMLAAAPEQALPLVLKHLRSVPGPRAERIASWIADLDDDSFATRQKATFQLAAVGGLAEPALRNALAHNPSLEVRRRVERLLETLGDPNWYPGRLRALRLVPLLENMNHSAARHALADLANGPPDDQRTQDAKSALERLRRQHTRIEDLPEHGSTSPELSFVVYDVGNYLRDPNAPVRKGMLRFVPRGPIEVMGDHACIEASYLRSYNGFTLGYVLRGKVEVPKLSGTELDLRLFSEAEITYTDDLLEAQRLGQEDVDQLIQQLYQPENRVKWVATVIPGGEILRFSPPMKKLMLLGQMARLRLQQCLSDPRIQNEVALILGAIGSEETVPLLIDVYPESDIPNIDTRNEASRRRNVMCMTFALTYLSGQPIGRGRSGADYLPGNRRLWKTWWAKERLTFKVPKKKPEGTWVPAYPILSQHFAKLARDEFSKGPNE